jgi:uncharacterized membrane protein YkvI
MATNTLQFLLSIGERKSGQAMVESYRFPGCVVMASGTGVIEIIFDMIGLFGALIILLVAGITIVTRAFEGSGVALVTTGVDVSAGQCKSRCGMIEKARFPAVHGMAR